jgi:hypothetical protein
LKRQWRRVPHNSNGASADKSDEINLSLQTNLTLVIGQLRRRSNWQRVKKRREEMVAVPKRKAKGRSAFKLVFPLLVLVLLALIFTKSQSSSLFFDILAFSPPSVGVVEQIGLCRENPYMSSFRSSQESIRAQADAWLENMKSHLKKAKQKKMNRFDHERYFPFEVMAECDTTCVGGACKSDTSKIVCGIEKLQTEEKCVVYSLGGNNQWEFELDILEKTPCEVHTFDCTGDITRFNKPIHPRLKFHHICLGAKHVPYNQEQKCDSSKRNICGDILTLHQIQRMLGHKRIDLFKMDIEGYEWPIFESWSELNDTSQAADTVLPMQVLVEIHFISPIFTRKKRAADVAKLQEHLLKVGYAIAVRDDNQASKHCTELTLIRYQCHQSSQQYV